MRGLRREKEHRKVNQMFSLKTYETEKGKLVAACDRSILGEKFEEEGTILNLKESFYHREKVNFKKIKEELREANTANLVGEELMEQLIEEGIVNSEEVKKVQGIPHVQIFVLEK